MEDSRSFNLPRVKNIARAATVPNNRSRDSLQRKEHSYRQRTSDEVTTLHTVKSESINFDLRFGSMKAVYNRGRTFYRVPEYGSCHGMSQRTLGFQTNMAVTVGNMIKQTPCNVTLRNQRVLNMVSLIGVSNLGTSLKILQRYKPGFAFYNHSRTATSTSCLLCIRLHPKCFIELRLVDFPQSVPHIVRCSHPSFLCQANRDTPYVRFLRTRVGNRVGPNVVTNKRIACSCQELNSNRATWTTLLLCYLLRPQIRLTDRKEYKNNDVY